MNRKQLINLATGQGFKGTPSVEALVAFFNEQETTVGVKHVVNIDGAQTELNAETIKSAWDTLATIATDIDANTAADVEATKKALAGATAAVKGTRNPNTGIPDFAPQTFRIGETERKAFNAQAARGDTFLPDADFAEVFGAWSKLAVCKGLDFADKAACLDICKKANVSYDFSSGGFAVPSLLRDTLISIRPKYSALAQLLPDIPVDIAGESIPRRSTGVTVYSPGEGVTATESNPTGDQVRLTPFEMVALNTVTKTQLAKSIINFGDWIASEMMYAIAKKKEEIYVRGDGTSTYFNQVGLLGKIAKQVLDAGGTWTIGTNATNAEYHSAIVRGSGNLWSELVYADFADMLSRPTEVENPGNMKWLCNRAFYYNVMLGIARSKGGVPQSEIINGVPTPMFEGFPVVFSNAMPSVGTSATPATATEGSVVAYFGEFDTCTKVATVPGSMEMSTSTERYWELRKIGYQIAVHTAINCHDLGTANSTKPAQTVPFAALILADS